MADITTINTIEDHSVDGYVLADCTLNIAGTNYTQQFTVPATDTISIVGCVKDQSEAYKSTVLANSALITQAKASSTDPTVLNGTIINL